MKIQKRLGRWKNKDILIEFLTVDKKGYNYDTKGKLTEVGDNYFIINELDEGGEKYLGKKLYLLNSILSISLYRE